MDSVKKHQVLKKIRLWRIWLRVCVSCRFVREMLLRVAPRCISLACTDNKANAALLLTVAWLVGWLVGSLEAPAGYPGGDMQTAPGGLAFSHVETEL
jgi:hypothetical protein